LGSTEPDDGRESTVKRLRSFFLAILLMSVLTSPAWADGGHGNGKGNGDSSFFQNFHPGRGNGRWKARNFRGPVFSIFLASGRATGGQLDPGVTVIPSGGSSQQATVCANLTPGWANPLAGSNWDSLQADCTTSLAGNVNDQYSTTFNLPANHPGVSISGNVLADDSVTIQLNGNTIFSSGGGYGTPTAFSSNNAGFFITGQNTLTFTVNNVTGPSGLDYVARVQAGPGQAVGQHRNDNDNDGD